MRSALAGLIWMAGCSAAAPSGPPTGSIRDLQVLPQDAGQYVPPGQAHQPLLSMAQQQAALKHLRERFFAPWHRNAAAMTPQAIALSVEPFEKGSYVGANTLPLPGRWYDQMRQRLAPNNLQVSSFYAIAVRDTSLRHLPTVEPLFEPFDKPGGGFPFDMLQSTALHIGTPLKIDYRISGWAFVQSPQGKGWMLIKDLALTSQEFRRDWEAHPLVAVIRDTDSLCKNLPYGVPASVGTLLPMKTDSPPGLAEIFVPAAEASFAAKAVMGVVDPNDIAILPLAMSPGTAATIANAMIGQPYGWGGLYGYRDCSAMTHDLFAPFGIWLPRNSAQQAQAGTVIPLKGLTREQKRAKILEQGRPWLTLLRSPGHIMLYIGQFNGQPAMLHNFWGIKTSTSGQEGRYVVGRCAITTLAPGAELPNLLPRSTYLDTMESMILLPKAMPLKDTETQRSESEEE